MQPRQPHEVEDKTHALAVNVAQWNILADGLAQKGQFTYARQDILSWNHREPRIVQYLVDDAAYDFITLQEVNRVDSLVDSLNAQVSKITDHWYKEKHELGRRYQYIFEPKCPSPLEGTEFPPDGPAIVFDDRRWQLLERQRIEFYHDENWLGHATEDPPSMCEGNSDIKQHSQRAIAGLFRYLPHDQSNPGNRREVTVIVCSMHFKAKEGAENERQRLSQAAQLKNALARLRNKWGSDSHNDHHLPPVFVGCDMNDIPESATHKVMTDRQSSSETTAMPIDSIELKLQSAYERTSWPEFTTWKFRTDPATDEIVEKKRNIDHIFFDISQSVGWSLSNTHALPNQVEIGCHGLPTEHYPSDHCKLAAKFHFQQPTC